MHEKGASARSKAFVRHSPSFLIDVGNDKLPRGERGFNPAPLLPFWEKGLGDEG